MMNNYQQEILNPKIWNNEMIIPEVAGRLNVIKQKFLNGLNENNIPMVIVDTRIVGSNASYNYTDFSDIDLHIVVDLSQYSDEDKRLLKMIYNYYKASFNDKYDIKIKGINVELYIEDVETPASSKGIYSLDTKEWLKKPEKIDVTDIDISKTLDYMLNKFEEVKIVNNSKLAQSLLDLLYANRIKSLAIDGEFGIDNLVFKEFRNRGYIQELKNIITNGESKELSLESLTELYNKSNFTTLYHASPNEFSEFDLNKIGEGQGSSRDIKGIWLSNDLDIIKERKDFGEHYYEVLVDTSKFRNINEKSILSPSNIKSFLANYIPEWLDKDGKIVSIQKGYIYEKLKYSPFTLIKIASEKSGKKFWDIMIELGIPGIIDNWEYVVFDLNTIKNIKTI